MPVNAYRNVLLRFPGLSVSDQLGVFQELDLPLLAIVHDGRNLVEGWVEVRATDAHEFNAVTAAIFNYHRRLRPDRHAMRPDAWARLPGATRSDGLTEPVLQRLLFLTIGPNPFPIRFAPSIA